MEQLSKSAEGPSSTFTKAFQNAPTSLIDPSIFEYLQQRENTETSVNDDLRVLLKKFDSSIVHMQGFLSFMHSSRKSDLSGLLLYVSQALDESIQVFKELAQFASKHSFYQYHGRWTRSVQNLLIGILLSSWLRSISNADKPGNSEGAFTKPGSTNMLLSLEKIGKLLEVPVDVKDQDVFHITLEEYLLAVMDMCEELSRYAMNAVTLGDLDVTVLASNFIKEMHSGLQMLNLKNDIVRRKYDGMKYHVKRVEEVIYGLSIRNLLPPV